LVCFEHGRFFIGLRKNRHNLQLENTNFLVNVFMKKILLLLVLVSGFLAANSAQAYTFVEGIQLFNSTISPISGFAVRQTPDEGYILTGYSRDNYSTGDYYYSQIYKLDKFGRQDWGTMITVGKASITSGEMYYYNLYILSIAVVKSDPKGYIAIGYSSKSTSLFLIKLDEAGNSIWVKDITFANNTIYPSFYGSFAPYGRPYSIEENSDGSYIVSCASRNIGYAAVIKFSKDGDLVWMKELDAPDLYINDIKETLDANHQPNGYIATGQVKHTIINLVLIRFDLAGNIIWKNEVTKSHGSGYSVIQSFNDQNQPDGYVVAGMSMIGGYISTYCKDTLNKQDTSYYGILVKFNDNGSTTAGVAFSGAAYNTCSYYGVPGYTVQQTSDGGYAVAGTTGDSSGAQIYLVKLNDFRSVTTNYSASDFYLSKIFLRENEANDIVHPIFDQTSDGGYVLTNSGRYDHLFYPSVEAAGLVKTDALGNTKDDGACNANHQPNTFIPLKYFNLIGTSNNWSGSSSDFTLTVLPSETMISATFPADYLSIENSNYMPPVYSCTTQPSYCTPDNHNVSGYAWSPNIGWISTNCGDVTPQAEADYGLNIDPSTGLFSGYAWSPNIGWIDFATTSGFPALPSLSARVDLSTGQVSGWARASANNSFWDGWIKLGDSSGLWPSGGSQVFVDSTNYSTDDYSEFKNWAWGGNIVGWVSFNSKDCDTNNNGYIDIGACGGADNSSTPTQNYKVITSLSIITNHPPDQPSTIANETWDNCSLYAKSVPTFTWTYLDDDDDPMSAYVIEVDSDSSFTGAKFNHLVNQTAPSNSQLSYALNLTQDDNADWLSSLAWGTTYWWRVSVKDDQGNWSASSTANSFTTPAHPYPWISFRFSPINPSLDEAVDVINDSQVWTVDRTYLWNIDVQGQADCVSPSGSGCLSVQNPVIKFTDRNVSGQNAINLIITDSPTNYSCSLTTTTSTKIPLPDWIEIPPTSFIDKFLATLSSFLKI
jgi:hypothetical protein